MGRRGQGEKRGKDGREDILRLEILKGGRTEKRKG
jgi:hypothetical protein